MSPAAARLFVIAGLVLARPAGAAFEAPRIEPSALGLGGRQPAWPGPAGSGAVADAPPEPRRHRGLRAATGRWEGIDELATDAVSAWVERGALVVSLAAAQRRAGPYNEVEVAVGASRPARVAGSWGWAAEASWGRWAIDGAAFPSGAEPPIAAEDAHSSLAGRAGPGVALAIGARVSGALSLAARWREWGGGLAADAPGLVEAGLAARLGAWTFAGAIESGSPGRSLRTLVSAEVACGRRLRLRGGFRPSNGETATGLGVDVGPIGVDVARRGHPRLGAHAAVGVTLRGGGAP